MTVLLLSIASIHAAGFTQPCQPMSGTDASHCHASGSFTTSAEDSNEGAKSPIGRSSIDTQASESKVEPQRLSPIDIYALTNHILAGDCGVC